MGVYTDTAGGYGYAINQEEVQKLEERYNMGITESIEDALIVIPEGWEWTLYNTGYDEPNGLLLLIDDDIVNAVLNKEEGASLPDMAVAKAWAKKYLIKFTDETPRLIYRTYTI